MRNRVGCRGFTLVELLVVIGIIGVLIGTLLPALHRARATSMRVKCMSNLRTMMQGCLLYEIQNHGRFPYQPMYTPVAGGGTSLVVANWRDGDTDTSGDGVPEFNWVYDVWTMLKCQPQMICPRHEDLLTAADNRDNMCSYRANGMLTQFGGNHVKDISNMVALTEFVIPTAGSQHMPVAIGTDQNAWKSAAKWYGWMVGNVYSTSNKIISDRPHEGGRNYAFLDGHVEWRRWQDVTSANFGLLIQGKNTYEAEDVIGSNAARAGTMIYP